MTYFIYTRLSKDTKGTKLGVERQKHDCEQLAKQHGLQVSEVFTDNDLSAHSGVTRPAFTEMMRRLENKEAKGVIVWHLDRLYRRVVDLEKIVDVVEHTGAEIRTVVSGDIDLNSATGRMMARILGSTSAYEVEHMKERVKAAIAQRVEHGQWLGGQPPYGLDRHPTQKGMLVINPKEAKITREVVARLLRGEGVLSVATSLNKRGITSKYGGKWRTSSLKSLATSPAIAGLSSLNGAIIGKGVWPAIVDQGDWYALQELLADPSRKTNTQGQVRKWQGAGVYVCGRCGDKLRGSKTSDKKQIYRCPGCALQVKQPEMDELVNTLILGYLDRPENRLEVASQGDDDTDDLRELTDKRAQLVSRKNRLGTLFADGQIDDGQLMSGTGEIARQLEEIDARLVRYRSSSPLAEMVLSGDDLAERWGMLSADARAKVIDTLLEVRLLPAGGRGRRTPVVERVEVRWKQ